MVCRYWVKVLTALRNDMKLPNGFEKEHPTEAELIRWLLQEDPNARPTTMELLKSDLLPAKLVCDPSCVHSFMATMC